MVSSASLASAPDPHGDWCALAAQVRDCRLCAARFAATASAHAPAPHLHAQPGAPILIASQAPGVRAAAAGRPFADASGDRLRAWLAVDSATFYDPARFAFLPMAFCFPGHDAAGGDLPPPPICAATWRARLLAGLGPVRLTLLVGGAAQRAHLSRAATAGGVTATVARWRDHAPDVFPLPHPSWRNTGWLTRHRWFAAELLPALRARLKEILP